MNLQTPEQRIIREQRERIDYLEEELRQMREALVPVALNYPRAWRLTPAEQRCISALYAAKDGFLTNDQLFAATCTVAASTGCDSDNLIKVRICNLRKKVAPLGIEIVNRWGAGYEMPPASIAIVKAAIERRAAA